VTHTHTHAHTLEVQTHSCFHSRLIDKKRVFNLNSGTTYISNIHRELCWQERTRTRTRTGSAGTSSKGTCVAASPASRGEASPVRRVLVAYQPISSSQRCVKPLTPSRWIKVRYQNGRVECHDPRVKTSLPAKSLNKYFHNESPVCYCPH